MKNYQAKILDWANDRNLIKSENAPAQRLKLLEEVGETARAILKQDVSAQKDGIGDIFVVLVILGAQTGESISFDFTRAMCSNERILYKIIKMAFENRLFNSIDWLNDLALNLNLDLEECVQIAYNEIKDRKGKTVNGTFIKE